MATVERNENGTIKSGSVLNPEGRSTRVRGFTSWDNRVAQLEEKYNTLEKLLALFVRDDSGKMSPGIELLQMNPRDVAIIMQSLGAVMGEDKRLERESFWDRFEGKPIQRTEISGPDRGAIEINELNSAKQKLLRGVVPDAPASGTDSADKPAN